LRDDLDVSAETLPARESGVPSRHAARLSERRRERAIEELQDGYARGSLGTATFERRLDCALSTDSPSALGQVTSDLGRTSLRKRIESWLQAPYEAPSSGLLETLASSSQTVLGRSRSCDIVLTDDSVSRRHAVLLRQGNRVVVADLGSSNGTYLNGRWVVRAEVLPGDILQLGEVRLPL
jgi:hypothetical protein